MVQFPSYNEHPNLSISVGNLIIKMHDIVQVIYTNVIASTSAEIQQREGEAYLSHLTCLDIQHLVWAGSLSSFSWWRYKHLRQVSEGSGVVGFPLSCSACISPVAPGEAQTL